VVVQRSRLGFSGQVVWVFFSVYFSTHSQLPNGRPVLFVPGNAGSSHQVRSIASSAARQFYSSQGHASMNSISRGISVLDFYAGEPTMIFLMSLAQSSRYQVEFNEDLSAFHGTTLQSQIRYTSTAVDYILSQYPPNTPLMILGHSMGGIVGTALLPSAQISAIITMSTPHTLPPARFDSRIDDIYAEIRHRLENDTTPILSLCGGATDMMIPSESCVLPSPNEAAYRRTVFTSALEGAWTGVGHREMVWCHQVRWQIARALLELTSRGDRASREESLDTWFRDGHKLPPGISLDLTSNSSFEVSDISYEIIPQDMQFIRRPIGHRLYLLPIPQISDGQSTTKLSILVGKGSIVLSPQVQPVLQVSVSTCAEGRKTSETFNCTPQIPVTLKSIPQPIPGQPFPRPRLQSDPTSGGTDESDGVVLYEAEVTQQHGKWVGIEVANGNGEGWIIAEFNHKQTTTSRISTLCTSIGLDFTRQGLIELGVCYSTSLSEHASRS